MLVAFQNENFERATNYNVGRNALYKGKRIAACWNGNTFEHIQFSTRPTLSLSESHAQSRCFYSRNGECERKLSDDTAIVVHFEKPIAFFSIIAETRRSANQEKNKERVSKLKQKNVNLQVRRGPGNASDD